MVEVSRDEASLEKSARMREGNISLILEGYHDIFSNFDPRPYSEKALSDDFLSECRRAARDKDEQRLELRFMIPKARRDTAEENKIKHRLKEHFHKHYREEQRAVNRIIRHGVKWLFFGAACMLAGAYLYSRAETGVLGLTDEHFLFHLLIVIFEPAGWFLCWEGLDLLFFSAKEKKPDLDFYRKMTTAEIEFFGY